MARQQETVVIEVPGAGTPPVTPGASPPETAPAPPDDGTEQALPAAMSEESRAILREGMANIGLGRHYGNALADWFDQSGMGVSIRGALEQPAFRIHSKPDVVPKPDPTAFAFTEDGNKGEVYSGEGEFAKR